MDNFISNLMLILLVGFIVYFALVFFVDVCLMVLSASIISKQKKYFVKNSVNDVVGNDMQLLTVLIAAYNESDNIVQCLNSLLDCDERHYQVIVINDGSIDDTMGLMKQNLCLEVLSDGFNGAFDNKKVKAVYRSKKFNNLIVVDKAKGGKSESLNVGLDACKTKYFVSIDADTLVEKCSLDALLSSIKESDNVVAAGGNVRISMEDVGSNNKSCNFLKYFLLKIQSIQYSRFILFKRPGLNSIAGELIIAGAFACYRVDIVKACGGYAINTVGEDMDLTIGVHRYCRDNNMEYKILFVPGAVAWTKAPATLHSLLAQRERWHRGMIESLFKHKNMLFNPRYGKVGLVTMPYYHLSQFLMPIIECLAWVTCFLVIVFGVAGWSFFFVLFMVTAGFTCLLNVVSILLENKLYIFEKRKGSCFFLKGIFFSVIENFWLRQFIVFYQALAFASYKTRDARWTIGSDRKESFDAIDYE